MAGNPAVPLRFRECPSQNPRHPGLLQVAANDRAIDMHRHPWISIKVDHNVGHMQDYIEGEIPSCYARLIDSRPAALECAGDDQ
jgi:hypothetical protein